MRAALRGIDVPHWVAVHGIDGVAPGVYRWPDLDTPIRSGDLRDLLAHVAMDQPLAGEAAYVTISAIHGGTSMTAATARPSWRREWSKDACTSPRMLSAPPQPE